MKEVVVLVSFVVALSVAFSMPSPKLPGNLKFVNNFIGSGGEGYGIGSVPPGAQVPFGMCRVGPDTVAFDDIFLPFNHFGGYFHNDSHIRLFSHTHMVGAGVLDYGTIGVMASVNKPTTKEVTNFGFRQQYSHDQETAWPGYYGVMLKPSEIFAEVTATTHGAAHRYTRTKSPSPLDRDQQLWILFDVSYTLAPKACSNASFTYDPTSKSISGFVHENGGLSNRFGGINVFFYATFNTSVSNIGSWNNGQLFDNQLTQTGTDIGAYFGFDKSVQSVEVYVGVSFISVDQAKLNLQAEITNQRANFDIVVFETTEDWAALLTAVEIPDGSTRDLTVFYSALYHSFMAPTTFSETGGKYLGFDNQVHTLPSDQLAYYTDMSIWDTHRTQFPLLGFLLPQVLQDISRSLVLMFQQGGDLPRWPLANGYTNCMTGQHADIVLADAYFKGLDFDIQTAYKGMIQGATQPQAHAGRPDLSNYTTLGYITYGADDTACSDTLEYTYDDWSISILAKALGNEQDYQTFTNRSLNYRNVWDDQQKYMCPKTVDGEWKCPPIWTNVFDKRYVEGDAWQWRWFVPHDPIGLMRLFGSTDYFVNQLETFFNRSLSDPYNILPNPYYWAGNEPDIYSVYMFNWAGRPDLTQYWSRKVLEQRFTTEPSGLPGNDDYGTMSAWVVWTSIGLYPLAGNGTYMIGSPLYPNITINLQPTLTGAKSSKLTTKLQIIAHNASPTTPYVQNALFNGATLVKPFITYDQLSAGGVLEMWMGSSASTWGKFTPPV